MKRFIVVEHHKGYWVIHDRYYHFLIDDIGCNPKTCEKLHDIAGDTNYERIVKFAKTIEKCKYFTVSELRNQPTPYDQDHDGMYYATTWSNREERNKLLEKNKCWVFPSEKNKELFDQLHPEL